ncbi:MAG: hypothetical protein MJE77_32280 [Proteobacteria bacterium]|nr:hypothetical protein [Pseudomonadota bacterium]
MKVACIHNENLTMFVIARYLRDRGVDAELLLTGWEKSHFLPREDADSPDEDFSWIKSLDWGHPKRFFLTPAAKIRRSLAGYDVLLGCGYVPAYLKKAGLTLDLFVPYGSDIFQYPYPETQLTLSSIYMWLLSGFQRGGLRDCRFILNTHPGEPSVGPGTLGTIRKLGRQAVHQPVFYVYYPSFRRPPQRSRVLPEVADTVDRLRADNDLLIVNHSRQLWRHHIHFTKGNDVLIKGFAEYIAHTDRKACLLLLEYGEDVDASKTLIRDLGIAGHVHWWPIMGRRSLRYVIDACDVVADQFCVGGTGSTGWEAVSMGKPLMGYFVIDEYRRVFGWKDFIQPINVRTAAEVTENLRLFEADPAPFLRRAEQSRAWFEKNMVDDLVSRYVDLIERAFRDKQNKRRAS